MLAHSFARKQSYYNILHIADALVSFNLLTFHIITRVTRFSHVVTLTFALNRSNFYSCALTVCTMAPLFLSIRHFMFSLSLSLLFSVYLSVGLSVCRSVWLVWRVEALTMLKRSVCVCVREKLWKFIKWKLKKVNKMKHLRSLGSLSLSLNNFCYCSRSLTYTVEWKHRAALALALVRS